jgi:hypothetical protein
MAKLKISELQRTTTVNYTDLFYLVQSNTSKATTVGNLLGTINGNVSVQGTFTANIIKMPNYTYPQANALIVSNGTVIYNSSIHKFQGYANGVWINLH